MAEAEKSPMWVALLSGAVVMGTGPLAWAFLIIAGRSEDQSGYAALAELVNEGGSFSYGILLTAAVGSMASAVLTATSVRRPGLPAPIALIPLLLVSLVALLGVIFGSRELFVVLAHAAPSDKGIILMGASAEFLSLPLQALAFSAAGAICVALAAAVSLGSPPRGGRALTLIGASVLGACLVTMSAEQLSVRRGFSGAVRSSPADRPALIVGAIDQWRNLSRSSNVFFVASLAVATVGGALLAAQKQKAAGIGAAATLVVAAIGFRGFNSLTERQIFSSINSLSVPSLMEVNGVEPSRSESVELGDQSTKAVDKAVRWRLSRHDMRDEPRWLGVELSASLEPKTLRRVLQVAHAQNATGVELVGVRPRQRLDVPPLFAGLVDAMGQLRSAAPVRVLFIDDECVNCTHATLSKTGLEIDGQSWAPGHDGFPDRLEDLRGVEVSFTEDLGALVRASLAALSHQRVLVVRVPLPDPMPAEPEGLPKD